MLPAVDAREIVMDRPGMNAMGTELMEWVRAELREAAGAPVLLTGTGKAFSAGLDIAEVTSLDEEGLERFLALLDDAVRELYAYPGPVVALVNGHAIAGGCVLTLCCDARIAPAGSRARIGLNEVAIGARFPPAVMAVVRGRVPRRHLERVVLGAELHDVEEAARLGLIDEVAEDADAVARARLALLASHPPDAYAAAKHHVRAPALAIAEAERRRWEEVDRPAWRSEPVRARLRALLAK